MEAEAPGRPAQRAKRAPDNGGLREERRVCGSTDRVSHLGAVAPSWTGSVVGSEVGPDVVCDRDAVARGGNGFLGLGRGRAPTCTAVRVVKMDGWAGGGRGLDHSARGRAKGASGVQSVCPTAFAANLAKLARAAYFISKPPTVALSESPFRSIPARAGGRRARDTDVQATWWCSSPATPRGPASRPRKASSTPTSPPASSASTRRHRICPWTPEERPRCSPRAPSAR